jgi:hypothetical protein
MSEVSAEPGILDQLPDSTLAADPDGSLAPDEDAPYGYTIDRKTKERRAKKLPGRPGKPETQSTPGESPSLESLRAEKVRRTEDRAPGKSPRTRRGRVKAEPAVVPYKAGVIAKGMNKLYAKLGRLVRAMDRDIGQAIIDSTRKESEDDVTVGEAWDELARTNPRIRRFLTKLITGGAWTQLLMAHMPIFLAIIMKDAIRKRIPLGNLVESVLSDDGRGEPSEFSEAFGGMTPEDGQQMMNMALSQLSSMGIDMSSMFGANGSRAGNPVRSVVPGEMADE